MPNDFIAQKSTTHFEMVHTKEYVIKSIRKDLIHNIMQEVERHWLYLAETDSTEDIASIKFSYSHAESPDFSNTGEIKFSIRAHVVTTKDIQEMNESAQIFSKKTEMR